MLAGYDTIAWDDDRRRAASTGEFNAPLLENDDVGSMTQFLKSKLVYLFFPAGID